MLRIIHLSDIHLSNDGLDDFNKFIMPALVKDLKKFNSESNIDIILFSGDLLNKGGESFNNDIDIAFETFEKAIINPLINEIGISKNRIFIAPGNHDIKKDADTIYEEAGLSKILNSTIEVNKYINSNDLKGIRRILFFKNFEKKFYEKYPKKHKMSNFQSSFQVAINDYLAGVTCFNSAWRCYDSSKDKNKIILGEKQVVDARDIINDCYVKIAVIHHPLDWLVPFDQNCVTSFIEKDYDLLFCGHIHEGSTWTKTGIYGSLFVSVAPSNWTYNVRSSDRNYANGYSIIDFDKKYSEIKTYYRRYCYKKECFDPNTDLGNEQGIFVVNVPNSEELLHINHELRIATTIKEHYFEEINEHLITYKTDTKAPKDLNGLFVLPRIVSKENYEVEDIEEEEKTYTIEDLCNTNENTIIFGTKEAGKTILLDKLLIEFTNNINKYHKSPIYIDFEKIGNKRFETIICQFLEIGIRNIPEFLTDYKSVFLIDNLSFNKNNIYKINRLEKFLMNYEHVQVIATSFQEIEGEIPINFLDLEFSSNFRTVYIKSFKTKQIRELMQKWFQHNEDFNTPDKLDKLLATFITLNLPRTPLTISIFLWIIEQQENYKPINTATMLENFIERLLVKLSNDEIYSEEFDFKNKESLLADIAYQMYISNLKNYRLLHFDLIEFINENLRIKKFDFIAEDLLEYFLLKGILQKEIEDANLYIRFRFSCFFQYFLMKKIDFDYEFRKYILREENFLKFINEIEYFTGLKRDQSEILSTLVKRMKDAFLPLINLLNEQCDEFDNIFSTPNFLLTANLDATFINEMRKAKPSDKEIIEIEDGITDEMFKVIKPEMEIKLKEDQFHPLQRLEMLWTLTAKVLKNTEETKVTGLKEESYQSILNCCMAYSSLYKLLLEEYIKINKIKIDDEFNKELNILKKCVPLLIQISLYTLMGTGKLKMVIREKIEKDISYVNISEFEKFLSVFLYSDLRGNDYITYIKKYIKNVNKKYVYDLILFKLVTYYFIRSKNKETDHIYEDLISELIIRSKKLKKISKGRIMTHFRKIKDKKRKEFDDQLIFEF